MTLRRSAAPLILSAMLLAAFVFLFGPPQSAAAHDVLVDSSPADGSTVETLPSDVTLTFSADLMHVAEIKVLDAAGNNVANGDPVVEGTTVTQPLAAEGEAGEYTVLAGITYSDGHPDDQEIRFTVTTSTIPEATADPTPEATEAAEETAIPAPTDTQSAVPVADDPNMTADDSASPVWFIVGGVVLLGFIVVLVVLLARRKKTDPTGSEAPAER